MNAYYHQYKISNNCYFYMPYKIIFVFVKVPGRILLLVNVYRVSQIEDYAIWNFIYQQQNVTEIQFVLCSIPWTSLSSYMFKMSTFCHSILPTMTLNMDKSRNVSLPFLSSKNSMNTRFLYTNLTRTLPQWLFWGLCKNLRDCISILVISGTSLSSAPTFQLILHCSIDFKLISDSC